MGRLFEVRLQGQPVGVLREADTGFIEFRVSEIDPWVSGQGPVLGQAFLDNPGKRYVGRQRELPPFFANLVPEGELRPFLEQRLFIAPGDDLELLERVGHDLPGAVEIARLDGREDAQTDISVGGIPPREAAEDDEELRFSLAGVQLKFSVVRAKEKITFPIHGQRGDSIVKLDSERFPGIVENEYSVLEWARLAGFGVPECEIRPTTALQGSLVKYADPGVSALVIRRYDRHDGTRIHQEDFAQVLNVRPRNKYADFAYERLLALVARVVGDAGADEFVRRLVFVIASGNSDAHLKNWSLVYPDRVNAQLSPLYDQVSTVVWPELQQKLALKLAGVREFVNLRRDTFERLSARAGLDAGRVLGLVDETLERIASAFDLAIVGGRWRMSTAHTAALREHWRRTPILAQSALAGLRSSDP